MEKEANKGLKFLRGEIRIDLKREVPFKRSRKELLELVDVVAPLEAGCVEAAVRPEARRDAVVELGRERDSPRAAH